MTIFAGDMASAIDESMRQAICKRETRSLEKRITAACLANMVQAMMRAMQDGGGVENMRFINPATEFPKPNNDLLIQSLDETQGYINNIQFGDGVDQQHRDKMNQYASWVAFGEEVGNLVWSGGSMKFPKSFLDSQVPEIPDTDGPCPTDDKRPYCINCGGNQEADNLDTYQGKCKGFPDLENYLADCPCYIDRGLETPRYTSLDMIGLNGWLDDLFNGNKLPGDDPDPTTTPDPTPTPTPTTPPRQERCPDPYPSLDQIATMPDWQKNNVCKDICPDGGAYDFCAITDKNNPKPTTGFCQCTAKQCTDAGNYMCYQPA